MIHHFIAKGWIKAAIADEEFYLSAQGDIEVENYFSNHFYPTNLNQLTQGKKLKSFGKKYYF